MLLGLPEGPEELVPGQALPLESSMDIHGGGEFYRQWQSAMRWANQSSRFQERLLSGPRIDRPDISYWSHQKTHTANSTFPTHRPQLSFGAVHIPDRTRYKRTSRVESG